MTQHCSGCTFINLSEPFRLCPAGPRPEDWKGPVLAIGVFDGVHVGHRSLLRTGEDEARRRAAPFWALTFWPHPEAVLGPAPAGGTLLSTLQEKVDLLKQAGVSRVLVLSFDRATATVGPGDFVAKALASGIRPQTVVVGFNFSFGRGGRGTPSLLQELCRASGIDVWIHSAVRLDGEVVSSTAVRAALAAGNVERAGLLLGRPFSLAGRVERGAGRGHRIGFPTANVAVPDALACPSAGVYVCSITSSIGAALNPLLDRTLPAVANIGVCPTFAAGASGAATSAAPRLEAHVLAGTPPTYGDEVRVFFHQRLRPEIRFAGPAELAAQIGVDRSKARDFFGLNGAGV